METARGHPVTTAPRRVLGSAAGGLHRLEIPCLLNCLSCWRRSSGLSPLAGSAASVQPHWTSPEHDDPTVEMLAEGKILLCPPCP